MTVIKNYITEQFIVSYDHINTVILKSTEFLLKMNLFYLDINTKKLFSILFVYVYV